MTTSDELLVSQRADQTWIVRLPRLQRPWAIERSREAAIMRAQKYHPAGVVRVRYPDGQEMTIRPSGAV